MKRGRGEVRRTCISKDILLKEIGVKIKESIEEMAQSQEGN